MTEVAKLFAASVISAVGPDEVDDDFDEEERPTFPELDEMDADEQAYYVGLAVRDLKMVLEAANFDLGNIIATGKPVVSNMFFSRDGSADIELTLPLEIEPQDDYSGIPKAFKLNMRSEFENLLKYKLNLPTASKPTASILIDLHMPSAMVTSIGADKFDTRSKVLQKYLESMFKKELG